MNARTSQLLSAALVALLAAGCGSSNSSSSSSSTSNATATATGGSSGTSSTSGSSGASSGSDSTGSSSASSSSGSGSSGSSGCTTPPTPPPDAVPLLAGACDPLVPTQCGYPFPSNVYLVDDASTVTGKRVQVPSDAMPFMKNLQAHVNPSLVADQDGFSPGMSILTHLPGATITGLPTQHDLADSVLTTSPTIILDAENGTLVPHWSELDMELPNDADSDRTFIIRPAARLLDGHRYIVAIRHVKDANGNDLVPTPAFQALRDGTASCEPSVDLRRALYADIFAKLSAAGINTNDLQLAWDFSTASRENNTRWFLQMRDDALAQVGQLGPSYTLFPPAAAGTTPDPASASCNNLTTGAVNSAQTNALNPQEIGSTHCSQDSPNPHIWRRLFGLMTVPLYLTSPNPGSDLNFGDGGVVQNGVAQYEFEVNIPVSATTSAGPATPMQNGHGLLGSKTEGDNGYLATIDDQGDYASVSVDLLGMAADDLDTVLGALAADPTKFKGDIGRQHQGILNELLSMRLMNGLAQDPATYFNGQPTIDATHHLYRGDSQGGIFGTTYMAVTTDVTRGVVGEPGMPYDLLLNRSEDFSSFFSLLQNVMGGSRDIQLLLAMFQMDWDRTEPDGYAPYIVDDNLPNTPAHQVLIHAALGDYQVTPLGAELIARTIGAKNLSPVNREIYGVTDDPGPINGSAIVEWNFGLLPAPDTNTPPEDLCAPDAGPLCGDPHDQLRIQPESIQQEIDFFNTGLVDETCGGAPCVGIFQ